MPQSSPIYRPVLASILLVTFMATVLVMHANNSSFGSFNRNSVGTLRRRLQDSNDSATNGETAASGGTNTMAIVQSNAGEEGVAVGEANGDGVLDGNIDNVSNVGPESDQQGTSSRTKMTLSMGGSSSAFSTKGSNQVVNMSGGTAGLNSQLGSTSSIVDDTNLNTLNDEESQITFEEGNAVTGEGSSISLIAGNGDAGSSGLGFASLLADSSSGVSLDGVSGSGRTKTELDTSGISDAILATPTLEGNFTAPITTVFGAGINTGNLAGVAAGEGAGNSFRENFDP